MLRSHKGKVVSIHKDSNFGGKIIAKVNTKPNPMYFFLNRNLKAKKGDLVEIIKKDNCIMYESVNIISK